MTTQSPAGLSHLVVYGASWVPRNKVWRVPVIGGYVVEATTGECRDPLPFAEHLRSLGCRVALVRAGRGEVARDLIC